MSNDSVEDRLAIRERIEAYSDAVFRRDAEAWIANWGDEAVWRLPGHEISGKPQIQAAWTQAMESYSLAGFFATPGMIAIDGASAKARVYTQEVLVGRDGKVLRIVGVYDDRLAKTSGAWLFTERSYTVLHAQ